MPTMTARVAAALSAEWPGVIDGADDGSPSSSAQTSASHNDSSADSACITSPTGMVSINPENLAVQSIAVTHSNSSRVRHTR